MKTIHFSTGNARKLREAREACRFFDIKVDQAKLDIDEIQSRDPIKITKHKAEQAFAQLQKPVVVNDASWNIPALNCFPGGYVKDIANWFTPQNFIDLIKSYDDRRIINIECIFYIDASTTKHFIREFEGQFAEKPAGENGNSMEKVVILNGLTIAQHHDKDQMAFKPENFIWHDFAKWYAQS